MSQEISGPPPVRRIVTKHDNDGKAVVGIDNNITAAPIPAYNVSMGKIWVTDTIPSNDNNLAGVDGAERPIQGIVSAKGTSCLHTDLGPGVTVAMHRTSSVDVNVLISGELVLIMEDGTEHHLKNPGDTIVQRGTLHGWKNPGNTWTRWVTFVIDAEPALGVNGEKLPDVV